MQSSLMEGMTFGIGSGIGSGISHGVISKIFYSSKAAPAADTCRSLKEALEKCQASSSEYECEAFIKAYKDCVK